ncbi:MAG: hypothetical protein J6A26_04830 [Oscillospiraceae bacterium]|nr:hypothetical protein [Oscillospiraceae bacterium]
MRNSKAMFGAYLHIPLQLPGLSVLALGAYSSLHCLCGIDLSGLELCD